MTTETTLATAAGQLRRQVAISQAARHLYDAETALHTARQSGVGASATSPDRTQQCLQSQQPGGLVRM